MKSLQDAGHLLRLAAVLLIGLAAFAGIRSLFVPATFGQYGHYRAAAMKEIAALPISHAGQDTCAGCHPDVLETKAAGKHAKVHCEACHGPQNKHATADNPADAKPPRPDTAKLCARCHEGNIAKPHGFPQVNTKEHSGGEPCNTCHKPHSPQMGDKK
jgi:hypothetical protein